MKPIIHKYNYVRSKIYTDSAKDQSCTICGTNVGTTVFVHLDEQWAAKRAVVDPMLTFLADNASAKEKRRFEALLRRSQLR